MSNDSHDELDELEPISEDLSGDESPKKKDEDELQEVPELEDAPALPDAPEVPASAPSEGAAPQMPSAQQMQAQQIGLLNKLVERSFSGMACPLFNPNTSKEYYRFFFGGLLMVIGCLMPFDADWSHLGYKTFAGAFFLIIGLGVCWSMWAAVNTGMVRMKWILLTTLPFIYSVFFMISPFPPAEFGGQSERAIMGEAYETPGGITESRYQTLLALRDDLRAQDPRVNSWGEFGQAFGKFQHDRGAIGDAFQHSGPGKWLLFLGALFVEFTFIMSIFGGAKQIKEQKAQRVSASSAKRRR